MPEAEADRLTEILEEGDIRQELASRRGKKADHPDKLQRIFRGSRFAREDTRLLDFEGAEVWPRAATR